MQTTYGYLIEWEAWDASIRDVFIQSEQIANEIATKVRLNGYRVWMRKAICVNGYLQK